MNNVYFFVFLAILSATITRLLHRYVAKDTEPYAYSWLTQVVSTLLFLPIALTHFSLPKSITAWAILLGACILWVLVDLSALTSYKKTEVSIKEPIGQTKLVWALLLGILLLGETFTWNRAFGTFIIFFGVSLLLWHPERKLGRLTDPGVKWTLATAFLSGIIAITDKTALGYFNPELYGFLVYLGPALIMTAFLPRRTHHVRHLFKIRWKTALLAILFSTLTYYFHIKAYSLADITLVYPILQIGTITAVLAGIFFLGEREHIPQKILASLVVVIGAIVVGS